MSKTKGRRAQRRFMTSKPIPILPDKASADLLREIREIANINRMGHAFKRKHEERHRGYGQKGAF